MRTERKRKETQTSLGIWVEGVWAQTAKTPESCLMKKRISSEHCHPEASGASWDQ